MKLRVVALFLACALTSWGSISCDGSQNVVVDGTGVQINFLFSSRRLLETNNMNAKSGLEEEDDILQENKVIEAAVFEQKGKEKSGTEEESSEMESNLILPEEADDSEPDIAEGQKKLHEREEQVGQIEQQDIETMIENKGLMDEKKTLENVKPKSDVKEIKPIRKGGKEKTKSDSESMKREGKTGKKFAESSKLEAETEFDSEFALDEEVESLTNIKNSEEQKEGVGGKWKQTESKPVQNPGAMKDTKGKKMQQETAAESNMEENGIESEMVSLQSEGFEDNILSDVANKRKKQDNDLSDLLSESRLTKGERLAKNAESKPQKPAEHKTTFETQRNSGQDNAQVNSKTNKEKKPRKERKGKKMSKVETPTADKEINSKPESTISRDLTRAIEGEKDALDSVSKSEPVEGVQGLNRRAEKKLEKEAAESLDVEQKERESQIKSIRDLSKASPKGIKDRISGKETEGEENSEMELQVLSEGNELKDTDGLDEISDAVTKAKKETEQVSFSESEPELIDAEGWDKELDKNLEHTSVATLDVETNQVDTHNNAEKNVAKRYQAQREKLSEMEQEETSNVNDLSKKIQDKRPQKKIHGEGGHKLDLHAAKKKKAVGDFDDGIKNGRQSGMLEAKNHISARDSDDDDEDDDDNDFMQDFAELPSKFQDTAQKLAGHFRPNIEKFADTSKVYFNKANQQISESFSPLVGKQYAPFLASLISYGLLLLPLAVVIIVFEHVRALLSLQKVLLFMNIYLAAYFATLLLATFVIGSEPMTFFYKNSTSNYLHLQLLQGLGYIAYLALLTFDVFGSCSSETLSVKVMAVLQWLVAVVVGLHYYVTVFHRAMGMKAPRTSWKIYGMYTVAFAILSLFARIKRIKKGYSQLGDADTDKKN